MYLLRLKLENFRNAKQLELQFEKTGTMNILIGSNGAGKTNVLEAIFLLSFPKSFRSHNIMDLIHFNQNHFLIEGEFSDLNLIVGAQKNPIKKIYKMNANEVKITQYLTGVQTVLFTPEDVELLNNSPSQRRRYMDTILSQVKGEYFDALLNYTKILKQRNALLKRILFGKAQKNELKFWDQKLIFYAEIINSERSELIKFMTDKISTTYNKIADSNCELKINYMFANDFAASLKEAYSSDTKLGFTTVGPHRDDFVAELNAKNIAKFCSRGEKRSFVLALKYIEMEYMEMIANRKPILLLDDVFSELDKNRRLKLLQLANNYQTIITTVEQSYFTDYKKAINLIPIKH